MSKNVMQINKEIEEKKMKDFEKRKNAMFEAIKKLSKEYNIDLVAIIQASPNGIMPMIAFVETPPQPEVKPEEQKKPKLEI